MIAANTCASVASSTTTIGRVRRLTAMTLDDLLNLFEIEPCNSCQEPSGLIEIFGVLAKNGDGEGVTVLDQHLAVAVEQDAAGRPQRERALMVVLGHLLVFRVLDDLQDLERNAECGKRHDHSDLEHHQSLANSPAIVTLRHNSYPRGRLPARRRSITPGNASMMAKATTPTTAFPTA